MVLNLSANNAHYLEFYVQGLSANNAYYLEFYVQGLVAYISTLVLTFLNNLYVWIIFIDLWGFIKVNSMFFLITEWQHWSWSFSAYQR